MTAVWDLMPEIVQLSNSWDQPGDENLRANETNENPTKQNCMGDTNKKI
jgi:hypothetical protein